MCKHIGQKIDVKSSQGEGGFWQLRVGYVESFQDARIRTEAVVWNSLLHERVARRVQPRCHAAVVEVS
jgi:hypothetical protein